MKCLIFVQQRGMWPTDTRSIMKHDTSKHGCRLIYSMRRVILLPDMSSKSLFKGINRKTIFSHSVIKSVQFAAKSTNPDFHIIEIQLEISTITVSKLFHWTMLWDPPGENNRLKERFSPGRHVEEGLTCTLHSCTNEHVSQLPNKEQRNCDYNTERRLFCSLRR